MPFDALISGTDMTHATQTSPLADRHCVPCEGGVPPLSEAEVSRLITEHPQWDAAEGGKAIRRKIRTKNFQAAIDLFHRIAAIAEEEQHHPDLHLTGYRDVTIELTTYAIKGLSENDFILAAKIDRLPIETPAR